MSPPIIRVFPDAEAVSRAAAEEFVRRASDAVAARGRFTVALSGGSTPKRLYELLAEPALRSQADWNRVDFFWGDERCLPPDHAESNYHAAREAMLSRLPIPAGRVHRMEAERPDRDAAARDYQAVIAKTFGRDDAGPPPAFDLILLGMGPDGHTASLFPHNPTLGETARWVVAVHDAPKPPPDRMTLTYPILNAAYEVLFLVAGADKAAVLAEVLEGPAAPERLPSQNVRPDNGRLVWFVDRPAAARLNLAPAAQPGE